MCDCNCHENYTLDTLIPKVGIITDIRQETPDVKTFRVNAPEGGKLFEHLPGQCAMVCVPGVSEGMFSITSSPTNKEYQEFSIKRCGMLTESENVVEVFRNQLNANLVYVDATERFLTKLEGVEDPEAKRKIIGSEFIRVFEEEARKADGIDFLAQGTIYPDIVESGTKTAKMVKSHHNVGGLPEDLQFELVEPLKQLFKDEVRECGLELGLPYDMVYRQPFPGPGLGVRCLGAIERERLEAVRESDAILREEFAKAGLDKTVWQYFTIVPDFKSVGVRDNARSFEWPVIIRAVNTIDAMTASIEHIDWAILDKITRRILAEVKGVNRVCYDLSPKPNATIEWE